MKKIAADNNYLMFKQANCSNGQVVSPLTGDCVSMHQAIDEQNQLDMQEVGILGIPEQKTMKMPGLEQDTPPVTIQALNTEVQVLKREVDIINAWKDWANKKLNKI